MATVDKEIILLKVSGQDKLGVTAGLTSILATYDAVILDIGQADIHDTLSLGILFFIWSKRPKPAIPEDSNSSPCFSAI